MMVIRKMLIIMIIVIMTVIKVMIEIMFYSSKLLKLVFLKNVE